MTLKIVPLLILFGFFVPKIYATEVPSSPKDFLCGLGKPSILIYSKLFQSESDDRKVAQQFWMDDLNEEIKGLWITPQDSVQIIGRYTSSNEFYFCSYKFQNNKSPIRLYWGQYSAKGIKLKDDMGVVQEILYSQSLSSKKSYHIEQVENQRRLFVDGKVSDPDPETCIINDSFPTFFRGSDKLNIQINAEIQKIRNNFLPKDYYSRCEKSEKYLESTTVSIASMHTGERYISAKVDIVEAKSDRMNWTGEDFTFDRKVKKKIEGRSLLKKGSANDLLAEVQYRIERIFSQKGRLKNLDQASFSFSNNSLVVSFAPVDEKGWYLEAYRADIPIPFSIARKFVVDDLLRD